MLNTNYDLIGTIGISVLSGGIAGGATLAIGKVWLTERLTQSIAHEYATKIEQLKAELNAAESEREARQKAEWDQWLASQSAAHAAFSAIHAGSWSKRLDAIQATWVEFLEIRGSIPGCVIIFESIAETGKSLDLNHPLMTAASNQPNVDMLLDKKRASIGKIDEAAF